jgi:CRP-like cAMP-binding protein
MIQQTAKTFEDHAVDAPYLDELDRTTRRLDHPPPASANTSRRTIDAMLERKMAGWPAESRFTAFDAQTFDEAQQLEEKLDKPQDFLDTCDVVHFFTWLFTSWRSRRDAEDGNKNKKTAATNDDDDDRLRLLVERRSGGIFNTISKDSARNVCETLGFLAFPPGQTIVLQGDSCAEDFFYFVVQGDADVYVTPASEVDEGGQLDLHRKSKSTSKKTTSTKGSMVETKDGSEDGDEDRDEFDDEFSMNTEVGSTGKAPPLAREPKLVNTMGTGQGFGELGFFTGEKRNATVVAGSNVRR